MCCESIYIYRVSIFPFNKCDCLISFGIVNPVLIILFSEVIFYAGTLDDYRKLDILHHDGVRYACANCNKSYAQKKTLGRHLRLECGKTPTFSCQECSQMFSHRYQLIRHLRISHMKNISKLRNRIK